MNPNFHQELLNRTLDARTTLDATSVTSDSDSLESKRDKYGAPEYWEQRYGEQDTLYEWLLEWEDVRDICATYLTPRSLVLHIGCGNSTLGVDIASHGLASRVDNTDISPTVINQMRERFPTLHTPQCVWIVSDATTMAPPEGIDLGTEIPVIIGEGVYDCVLDKGTMDALMCKETLEEKQIAVRSLLEQVMRVLKPGGVYIVFSFGQPETRTRLFDSFIPGATYTHSRIACASRGMSNFVYVINKQQP